MSVDVPCDHDVIVHSWDVEACSIRFHPDLPSLTALFLLFFSPPASAVAQMTTQELLPCEYRPPLSLIQLRFDV